MLRLKAKLGGNQEKNSDSQASEAADGNASVGSDAETAGLMATLEGIGASQAMIEFEMDGTIITANQNFLSALGYELSEIVGKHHSIFADATYKESSEYRQFWDELRAASSRPGP